MQYCPHCGQRLEAKRKGASFCVRCRRWWYRNPAVGVAVLVVRDTRVLLARRRRGAYAGLWCVPCGYVEWDEDVRVAARRELMEETGLDVELGDVFDVQSNFHDPEHQSVGIWFLAHSWAGTPRAGDDVDRVEFFSFDALPDLAFPTDRIVLEKLARSLLARCV